MKNISIIVFIFVLLIFKVHAQNALFKPFNIASIKDSINGQIGFADANRDGQMDVLMVDSKRQESKMKVFLNDSLVFKLGNTFSLKDSIISFDVADLNNDHFVDFIYLSKGDTSTQFGILTGGENNSFLPFYAISFKWAEGFTMADFDNDGRKDISSRLFNRNIQFKRSKSASE